MSSFTRSGLNALSKVDKTGSFHRQ